MIAQLLAAIRDQAQRVPETWRRRTYLACLVLAGLGVALDVVTDDEVAPLVGSLADVLQLGGFGLAAANTTPKDR